MPTPTPAGSNTRAVFRCTAAGEFVGAHVQAIGPDAELAVVVQPRVARVVGAHRVEPPASRDRIGGLRHRDALEVRRDRVVARKRERKVHADLVRIEKRLPEADGDFASRRRSR